MKTLIIMLLVGLVMSGNENGIHQFSIKALHSEETVNFADFKGKKILIVNVASKCGFTPQYAKLQELYEKYKDKLVIVGVPCNQFAGQESGSEMQIKTFCSANYGVTFPMTTKVEVKGKNQHEIYKWLTNKGLNKVGDHKVTWNFNKFLIDENGELLAYFPSMVKPLDKKITRLLD